jgi:hypothetical protein
VNRLESLFLHAYLLDFDPASAAARAWRLHEEPRPKRPATARDLLARTSADDRVTDALREVGNPQQSVSDGFSTAIVSRFAPQDRDTHELVPDLQLALEGVLWRLRLRTAIYRSERTWRKELADAGSRARALHQSLAPLLTTVDSEIADQARALRDAAKDFRTLVSARTSKPARELPGRVMSPLAALAGIDLPALAKDYLGVKDTFSYETQSSTEENLNRGRGEIVLFVEEVMQGLRLKGFTRNTIATYIGRGRDHWKNLPPRWLEIRP